MTLELKVPFVEKEDALEFQRFLRKNGCQSRLETVLDFHEMVRYHSTIGNISKFLDDIEKRDCGKDIWEEESAAVEKARKWIDGDIKGINNLYSQCEVGVSYSFSKDILEKIYGVNSDFLSDLPEGEDEESEEIRKEKFAMFTQVVGTTTCLSNSGCLTHDLKTDTVILTEKKPVEELEIISVSGLIFGSFDPEDLNNAGISMSMQTSVTNDYTVIAGPEFILIDFDELIDYLSGYEDEEDDEDNEVVIHIKSCILLVHRIMDFIEEKPLTIEELGEKLFEEDERIQISFDVVEEAMQGILSDMKKLDLITIKNGVIKPAK